MQNMPKPKQQRRDEVELHFDWRPWLINHICEEDIRSLIAQYVVKGLDPEVFREHITNNYVFEHYNRLMITSTRPDCAKRIAEYGFWCDNNIDAIVAIEKAKKIVRPYPIRVFKSRLPQMFSKSRFEKNRDEIWQKLNEAGITMVFLFNDTDVAQGPDPD